jgi:hypothetical protein
MGLYLNNYDIVESWRFCKSLCCENKATDPCINLCIELEKELDTITDIILYEVIHNPTPDADPA